MPTFVTIAAEIESTATVSTVWLTVLYIDARSSATFKGKGHALKAAAYAAAVSGIRTVADAINAIDDANLTATVAPGFALAARIVTAAA